MKKFIVLIGVLVSFSSNISSETRSLKINKYLSHTSGNLGAYSALIIGINDYVDNDIPDLETAVNDAMAVDKVLRNKYNFKTKLILDRKATRKTVYNALRTFASSAKPDDSILIYYAGHGDLDRQYNDGWWIPVDAKGGNPVTYLDNIQVQKAMANTKARHVLLISDSCYSGTLFGKSRSIPSVITDKYYLSMYNEKSRWGMTSGNKTPVSDVGTDGHSIFAYQFIKELKNNDRPYITTQEIYTRIAPIVGNNSEQTPLCKPIRNTGDQGGEFVFVRSSVSPEVPLTIMNTTTNEEPVDVDHKLKKSKIPFQPDNDKFVQKAINSTNSDIWDLPEISAPVFLPRGKTITSSSSASGKTPQEACAKATTMATRAFFKGRRPTDEYFKKCVYKKYCNVLYQAPNDQVRVEVIIEFYKRR